jgi:hypothetical protein
MSDDVFNGVGIEIELPNEDSFLKVRETLTRCGVAGKQNDVLYQSCHILHKRGRYAIMHFKEMFILDGKSSTFDEFDLARRNTICRLLQEWGLIKVKDQSKLEKQASMSQVKIIPHKEKSQWTLVAKYQIGKKKSEPETPPTD